VVIIGDCDPASSEPKNKLPLDPSESLAAA